MEVIDQMGRKLFAPAFPKRIISLVPSQTELLYYLGLKDRIVGVTKFCVHPQEARQNKVVIGGTKKVHINKVKDLEPDLILGNKEENTLDIVLELEQFCSVWMSDINTFNDAVKMFFHIGTLLKVSKKANLLVNTIEQQFRSLNRATKQKALYFIWANPYMVAASNTFINSILEKSGYQNAVGRLERYPQLTEKEITNLEVDVVMLSSEPYPFKEKHKDELKRLLPDAEIALVDGEYFSWYGSRLLGTPKYLNSLHFF